MSTEVPCLGVVLDSEIKLTTHVRKLAGRCFYYLRQLWAVRRSVNADVAKTLVNAFITSQVNYCNSVFNNISAAGILPLQRVLNAAARVIVRKRKYDHITASFVMIYNGYQYVSELNLNCAVSSISAFIRVLHHILPPCV